MGRPGVRIVIRPLRGPRAPHPGGGITAGNRIARPVSQQVRIGAAGQSRTSEGRSGPASTSQLVRRVRSARQDGPTGQSRTSGLVRRVHINTRTDIAALDDHHRVGRQVVAGSPVTDRRRDHARPMLPAEQHGMSRHAGEGRPDDRAAGHRGAPAARQTRSITSGPTPGRSTSMITAASTASRPSEACSPPGDWTPCPWRDRHFAPPRHRPAAAPRPDQRPHRSPRPAARSRAPPRVRRTPTARIRCPPTPLACRSGDRTRPPEQPRPPGRRTPERVLSG